MKKTFIIMVAIAVGIGCAGEGEKKEQARQSKENLQQQPSQAAEDPVVTRGLELVGKSDCFTCHKVSEAGIGPAYEAVAARYEKNEAVIDSLAGKIISGGAGNWGAVPMTPHPDLSKEDAKAMVTYVLSLKP